MAIICLIYDTSFPAVILRLGIEIITTITHAWLQWLEKIIITQLNIKFDGKRKRDQHDNFDYVKSHKTVIPNLGSQEVSVG